MTEITLRLIRSCNPQLDIDNLEECSILTLNDCNIETIENLELFSHLTELKLCGNSITAVENLTLFSKLQYLDVSRNKITSQGLLRSVYGIPPKLNTINLSGNPCVSDEDALTAFQEKFPNLFIVIEDIVESAVDESEQADVGVEDGGDDEEPVDVSDAIAEIPADMASDAVLSYIVNRKCKLQAIGSFNLDSTVAVSILFDILVLFLLQK